MNAAPNKSALIEATLFFLADSVPDFHSDKIPQRTKAISVYTVTFNVYTCYCYCAGALGFVAAARTESGFITEKKRGESHKCAFFVHESCADEVYAHSKMQHDILAKGYNVF